MPCSGSVGRSRHAGGVGGAGGVGAGTALPLVNVVDGLRHLGQGPLLQGILAGYDA